MVTCNKWKNVLKTSVFLEQDSRKMSSEQALNRRLNGYLSLSERAGIDKIAFSLGNRTQGFQIPHKAITGNRCRKLIAIARHYIAAIRRRF